MLLTCLQKNTFSIYIYASRNIYIYASRNMLGLGSNTSRLRKI